MRAALRLLIPLVLLVVALAGLAGASVEESSTFAWRDGLPELRHYRYAQAVAWRDKRRELDLLPGEDGIAYDDLVVTQNLPRQGRLSICRVVGPYDFDLPDVPRDYGHILPVEVLAEEVSRHHPSVSDALRQAISLRPRLYEITPYGGDVEALVTRQT